MQVQPMQVLSAQQQQPSKPTSGNAAPEGQAASERAVVAAAAAAAAASDRALTVSVQFQFQAIARGEATNLVRYGAAGAADAQLFPRVAPRAASPIAVLLSIAWQPAEHDAS